MVLTRAEAIQGWRAMMGPVDPEEAKEQDEQRYSTHVQYMGVLVLQ